MAVIFQKEPEVNKPRVFAQSGLKYYVSTPICIRDSNKHKQFWKIVKHGFFPLFGKSSYLVVHKPLAVSEYDFAELMEETESEVVKE
jgi:1-acyl-sn-glycerol-3-phosphate acyltransferase